MGFDTCGASAIMRHVEEVAAAPHPIKWPGNASPRRLCSPLRQFIASGRRLNNAWLHLHRWSWELGEEDVFGALEERMLTAVETIDGTMAAVAIRWIVMRAAMSMVMA
jgi:hypothetical protein